MDHWLLILGLLFLMIASGLTVYAIISGPKVPFHGLDGA